MSEVVGVNTTQSMAKGQEKLSLIVIKKWIVDMWVIILSLCQRGTCGKRFDYTSLSN